MNEKQKEWLLKIEQEIRTKFPGDPMADDDQCDQLIEYAEDLLTKANRNIIVKRWIMEILYGYNERHKILIGMEAGRNEN